MAISEAYSNSGATISTTEYSLTANSTTLGAITTSGIYQIFLDLNAMAAGDQYQLKIYEKIVSGGTQRSMHSPIFGDVQTDPIIVIPTVILLWGWEVTMKKLAGTDRSIGWSIRKVA
jgi:hypothetical protein